MFNQSLLTAAIPFLIFLGIVTTAAILFFMAWNRFSPKANKKVAGFSEFLDRAGMHASSEEITLKIASTGGIFWILLCLFMHASLITGIILFPLCIGAAIFFFRFNVQRRIKKRLSLFCTQLELALRLIGNGVRVGLSLQQALNAIIEELPDPSRYEYRRVIGQTNIGVGIYDALDTLATRMPSKETMMMVRAIRIQSQTGGDLSGILEHLANTIRERRRIQRKIQTLTAEGRASAGILSALPPFLAIFIGLLEPSMGKALLFTLPGHIALGIVCVLESAGVFVLMKMVKIDV